MEILDYIKLQGRKFAAWATKDDLPTDYATQHTLTELICPNNVPNMAFGEGGTPAVRTGRAVKVGDVTYYEWRYVDQSEEVPEIFYTDTIYAEQNSPIYYEPGGDAKASLEGAEKVTVAKQGSNPDATNTAILEAIKQGGGGGGSLPAEAAEQIAYTAEQLGYDGTPTEYEVISQEAVDGMIAEAWSTTFGKADPADPTSKDFQYICDMADALLYGDIQQSAQEAVEELMERLDP